MNRKNACPDCGSTCRICGVGYFECIDCGCLYVMEPNELGKHKRIPDQPKPPKLTEALKGGCLVWILLLLLPIVACTTGSIRVRTQTPAGDPIDIELEQPTDAAEAATLTVEPDGTIIAKTPKTHQPASYTEKATVNGLMIFGGLFGVAAVVLFVFKGKFPLMPSNAPVGCALASAACYMLPTIIDKYLLYILLGAAGWLIWVLYSYRHNKKLHETPVPVKPV